MYSILVVDDFPLDRKQMVQAIASFTDLPLELAGECEDGMQALEMVRDVKPDILLCDVEMPHVTGLELADELRKNDSGIRIIFCSLYEKLHYLKTAIAVHSDGYIMKPFTAQELHDCIARVLLELMDLDEQRKEMVGLQEAMENSRELLTRNFFQDLVYGYITDERELASRCHILGIDPCTAYRLAVVEIDEYYAELYHSIGERKGSDSLVCYRMLRMLENAALESGGAFYVIRLNERCYALAFVLPEGTDADASKKQAEDTLNSLISEAHAATISLTATFGDQTRGLLKMKEQCEQCRYRLDYKWLLGKGQIIYAAEVPGRMPQQTINIVEVQRQIRLLLNDTGSDVTRSIAEMTHKLLAPLTPLQSQILSQYVFTCIQLVLQENGTELAHVLPDVSALYLRILSPGGANQLDDLIQTMLREAHAYLNEKGKSDRSEFIDQVKDYIRGSDLRNVHLALVADQFSYSPNYLNHIFKEETGETILDYIIHCRIEKAKELMRQPGARLGDIAEQLGYSQATYFSVVFKKNEGITPKKYMEQEKES